MKSKIYLRHTRSYYEETQFMEKELEFLYHSRLGRFLLSNIVTKPWASTLCTKAYYRPKSVEKIPAFIKAHGINMDDYPKRKYSSFADFFTREITPSCRPIDLAPNVVISPADSKLTIVEVNESSRLLIKGYDYTLGNLLCNKKLESQYQNGLCLIFRLTVDDYHHYCFPDNGKLLSTREILGKLHTVGPVSNSIGIFKENHRIVNLLNTQSFGQVVMVEVGALLVGRIHNNNAKDFKKGEEKGYFSYGGSTILLFFKKDTITIDADILIQSQKGIETKVLLGEKIGTLTRK